MIVCSPGPSSSDVPSQRLACTTSPARSAAASTASRTGDPSIDSRSSRQGGEVTARGPRIGAPSIEPMATGSRASSPERRSIVVAPSVASTSTDNRSPLAAGNSIRADPLESGSSTRSYPESPTATRTRVIWAKPASIGCDSSSDENSTAGSIGISTRLPIALWNGEAHHVLGSPSKADPALAVGTPARRPFEVAPRVSPAKGVEGGFGGIAVQPHGHAQLTRTAARECEPAHQPRLRIGSPTVRRPHSLAAEHDRHVVGRLEGREHHLGRPHELGRGGPQLGEPDPGLTARRSIGTRRRCDDRDRDRHPFGDIHQLTDSGERFGTELDASRLTACFDVDHRDREQQRTPLRLNEVQRSPVDRRDGDRLADRVASHPDPPRRSGRHRRRPSPPRASGKKANGSP